MRIAIVTGIYPPDVGGPATHAFDLRAELSGHGHEPTVVTLWHGDRPSIAPGLVRFPRRWPWPVRLAAVAAWLATNGGAYDVVYATGLHAAAVAGARVARRPVVVKVVGDPVWERGRRLALTTAEFQGFQASRARGGRLAAMRWLRDRTLRGASAITAPSGFLAGVIDDWLGGPAGVKVIPNGVRIPDRHFGGAPRPEGELRLVFVGRLVAHKRVERLIAAVGRAGGVRLEVIGDGPERPALEEEARRVHAVRRVRFTGDLPRDQALERIAGADALALASDYEGLPHVVIEALAVGTPVVSPPVGGVAEVVRDGESGLIVPEASVDELAAAFSRLRDDPGLRDRLARGARTAGGAWRFEPATDAIGRVLDEARAGAPRLVLLGKTRIPEPIGAEYRRRLDVLVRHGRPTVIGVGRPGVRWSGRARIVRFPDLRPGFVGGLLYYPFAPALAVALIAGRPRSAIVCQSPYEGAGAALWTLPLGPLRPRIVVEVHGDWRTATRLYGSRTRRLVSPIADRVALWGLRRADRVRVVGGFTERLVREAGFAGELDRYVAFGDIETFWAPAPLPAPGEPQVAFVGALEPSKGVDVLLAAWGRVRERVPGATLAIAGEGSRRREYERLAAGLEGIRFLGSVPRPELRTLLDRSRFLVLPSRAEGLGRVILEAFARARPVVASRIGGIPELVEDGATGALVPSEDPEQLAGAIVALLSDAAGSARMGEAARRRVAERDPAAEFERGFAALAEWVAR